MSIPLPEEAQERDIQRTFILSLAGFSFTAVAGMAVLEGTLRVSLQLPAWYVLVSFVTLMASLNLQSYKSLRWQSQLATVLLEIGALALMLSLVALLFSATFSDPFRYSTTLLILFPWIVDHVIRISIDYKYLAERHSNL